LKRGYSLNKIRYSLIKKGIDTKYITASISKIKENESDPDFFSAIKICKRRRIGPCREENNRSLFYKKDISILARSGFSYEISKKVLEIPKTDDCLTPFLMTVPLQLLAYNVASLKNCDIDKPRNLAKSVTVE